jgi:hypothetical protein
MPDQHKSNEQAGESRQQSSHGEIPSIMTEQRLSDDVKPEESKSESTDGQHKNKQSESNSSFFWLSIIFDALLFIATSVYAYFAYNQRKTMEAQKRTMQESVTQTQTLIEQQKELVGHAAIQSLAAQTGAEATEGGVSVASNAVRLGERAWITSAGIQLAAEPGEDEPFTISIFVANTGKTPALELISQSRILITASPPRMNRFPEPNKIQSRTILAPGTSVANFSPDPWTPRRDMFHAYRDGSQVLYVQARLQYRDIFQRPHWTTICAYHTYGAPLDKLTLCETGNEIDRDQQADRSGKPSKRN